MWTDLLLQAAMMLVTIFMFLYMQNIPQKLFSKLLSSRNPPDLQSKRHFMKGAQLLAQAKASKDRYSATSFAKSAESEADIAIASNPKDAAAYILKALSLELLGFKTSALDSLDNALAPAVTRSLSGEERADALYKRAELKLAIARRGRVDSVIEDLVESVRLRNDNVKALCLLGECYGKKGMKEEAQKAYDDALKIQPNSTVAQEALAQLGLSQPL